MAAPNFAAANNDNPAEFGVVVVPSDSVNFSVVARGIYVGVAGDVTIVTPDGTALTFKNAPSGAILPVRALRVNLTATTATNLIALF